MLTHLNFNTTPKRVVVLGAQGFVGSEICRQLSRDNINFLGVSRQQLNLLDDNAADKLQSILKPEDALVVVSAIAPCKTNLQLIDNLRMMQHVCAALEKIALSHVVYISSDAVYSDAANPVTEASSVEPTSLHGMMHAARELMLKVSLNNKVPLAILRPSLLYGLKDPHNGYGPNRFRRLVSENKMITLFGGGEEKRDHIYIKNVAEIVKLTLLHRSVGILNIATGESLSFFEVADCVIKEMESNVLIQTTPRQNPITHRHFDILNCHKAFPDFRYTSFKIGIREILNEEAGVHA